MTKQSQQIYVFLTLLVLSLSGSLTSARVLNCNICGEGKIITNPDGVVRNPQNPSQSATCAQIQATDDEIPANLCALFPNFVTNTCGCVVGTYAPAPTAPTRSPTVKPTEAPTPFPTRQPSASPSDSPSPAPTVEGFVPTANTNIQLPEQSDFLVFLIGLRDFFLLLLGA